MLFIPYEKLILYSDLTKEVLVERLNVNVEPFTGFRFDNYSKSLKTFVGKVSEKNFAIRPTFKGRNSFVPYIYGSIEKLETGNIILLTLRLHYVALIILSILFIIMPIFLSLKYYKIGGIVFALITYCITIFGFNYEYNKAKITLQNILEANVIT